MRRRRGDRRHREHRINGDQRHVAQGPADALDCPECGGVMILKTSQYGPFYGCTRWPDCDGTHGAHADGTPLGTPANRETKEARVMAHTAFDKLWQSGGMTRRQAYRWMQGALGLTPQEAHIGRLDAEQCRRLVRLAHTIKQPAQDAAGGTSSTDSAARSA